MSATSIQDIYALSPMQQGMLFHSLYTPEAGVYIEQLCFVVEGDLNMKAFEQAWQQLVTRHPALRTAFMWDDVDKPLQVVYDHVDIVINSFDWRSWTANRQQQELETLLQADRAQGFDLSEAPLMRLNCFQLSAKTFQFVWSHHHLLLDGWSISLLLQELFIFYEASQRNESVRLRPARPYREYIAWLRRQNVKKAEDFWRHELANFASPTTLGIDHAPGTTSTGKVEEHWLELTAPLSIMLQEMARQQQVTLNTLLQAAWSLLLSRYSGQDDIVFGITVAGRPSELPGVETMVGLFINTLPVRVRIPAHETWISWLKSLQAQQSEAQQYAYSQLVQIQGWSEVPRGTSLFESLFVFENYPISGAKGGEQGNGKRPLLSIRSARTVEYTNYPLALVVLPGEKLTLKLTYDTVHFDAASIAQMMGHMQVVLAKMVAHPEQRLGSISLLTAEEHQSVVVTWNATQAPYPADSCVQQLFEEQVAKTPQAVAVAYNGQKLTYAELNERANQLAQYLCKLGVKPDALVGLCVERSLEMLIGIWGILKAGGAYLPLDPAHPANRRMFMLEDAQAILLLTQTHLYNDDFCPPVHTIFLDSDWSHIAQEQGDNLSTRSNAEHLAYVIYTSGSTGLPKGVMIPHRGLVNYVSWAIKAYAVAEGQGAAVHSSVGFDLTITGLFTPLLVGQRVILLPEDQGVEPLSQILRDSENLSLVKDYSCSPGSAQPLSCR